MSVRERESTDRGEKKEREERYAKTARMPQMPRHLNLKDKTPFVTDGNSDNAGRNERSQLLNGVSESAAIIYHKLSTLVE